MIFTFCKNSPKNNLFSFHKEGYWHQLISFNSDSVSVIPNSVYWITASFKNQSDSIFWDSYNNLNDNFFIEKDSAKTSNYFIQFASKLSEADSCLLLIKTSDFFKQQFNSTQIPFFSKKDSVVKVNLKVKRIYTDNEFNKLKQNLAKKEAEQIESYFKSVKDFELSQDSLGFYWLEKPLTTNQPKIKYGDVISLTYTGSFLNGRVIDTSPKNFKITYGTPDQILKGLNYVISRLKLGQNVKIILPSRLAFGEKGSSNFVIPPFTPLVYTLKINA
ncbi:MAG: FKBP-type peptidyl-prolyl cis-trans isomerase [Bacteroidota bacterium]|nr:FKBP-type peptidyl-prolyl cis-trans isomerase [Bacteroidota bacterium]